MLEVPTAATAAKKPPAILSMIGETPLVEITQFDTGPCHLFLKLENQNPTGSIKDRIALSMIEAAEEGGHLQPGGTVIEATAGNTGLGLALVAGAKGYRVVLVIPDKMSQEKISHVKALGAEVVLTRSDVTRGHPEYYQDVAARLTKEIPGAFYVNQFGNPANPLAHERTTGPEIWEQMRHDVDAIVVGVGSGGTLTGLGRFFNRVKPRRGIEMVLADPTGSVLYEWVKTGKLVESGSWAVEGIGEDFIPDIADMSLVTEAYEIDDEESFATARELLHKEGIFGGSSTGTLLAGALRYCRAQQQKKRVVSLVPDTGNKYLSKMFNDFWMAEQGFIHRQPQGDLSDLITHRYEKGEVITVGPTDSLLTAYKRMRDSNVSQLPVVDQSGRAVGILDESDVLVKVHRDSTHFNDQVQNAMTNKLETLSPTAKIYDLLKVFDRGRVAIVMDRDKFLGLITRTDLLSYLRLNMPKSAAPREREYS
ncbi:MAG TPA: pyridoxal-phosphate dependent enzyme [Chthoniobacterales bacterium]|nr:pyridoxal-phosphate dependent enzyme [Chthoniobacterales bacterium]